MRGSHSRRAVLALVLTLAGWAGLAGAAEVFPIEHFMKRPQIENITIAPDGQHAAAIVPREGQKVIAILDISDIEQARMIQALLPPPHEDAAQIIWLAPERVGFTTTTESTELTAPRSTGNLYAFNIDGSQRMVLAGPGGALAWFGGMLDRLEDDPKHVIAYGYSIGRGRVKAERVNILNGRSKLVGYGPTDRVSGMLMDHAQNLRFAWGTARDRFEEEVYYRDAEGDWAPFEHPFAGEIRVLGFNGDNRHAWIASRDREQFGLYRHDTETGAFEQVLSDPVSELWEVHWDAAGENVIGASFMPDAIEVRAIEPAAPEMQLREQLAAGFPGQYLRFTSWSDDGRRATLFVSSDVNPGVIYLFDAESRRLVPIAPVRPWIDPDTMAERRPFQFTARDGLTLHGYLTLPRGREAENLPMVVVVHGGPHGPFDSWFFDPEAQLLANRGYLVLQVNYRGSGGYGHQFERSGFRKWGREMQDDVTDATRWAFDQGLADPARTCIYGASYGGFATLSGITREPDLYRCAFAFVGVYDLELMKKKGNIVNPNMGGKWGRDYLDQALGTDPEDLKARSPIHHVGNISTPLYIVHGTEDRQAHVDNYHELRRALDAAEIPYRHLLIEREAHGFYDVGNRVTLYGEMLEFLEAHIGGPDTVARVQPAAP